MKYIIRAIKYFFYFSFTCAAIIAVLIIIGAVEGNVDTIFEEGYRSVGKIAIFFAIVAAVYPKLGFITRDLAVNLPWEDIRKETVEFFSERRYELESESPERVSFRIKGMAGRLSKMYEDRLTLTRTIDGWQMEGLRKDTLRLSGALEHRLAPRDTEQELN